MDATGGATGVVVVSATTPDRDLAERVASAVVEEGLAACAQVGGPIRSSYRWQGAVQVDDEWTLTIKTSASGCDALVERIVGLHPYEVPEVVVTPVVGGHVPYLDWVRSSVD